VNPLAQLKKETKKVSQVKRTKWHTKIHCQSGCRLDAQE